MSKVLITGGTGYIGQYLADYFVKKGDQVVITSRKEAARVRDFDNRRLDLLDFKTIEGITKGIDVVIHTANWDELLIKEYTFEAYVANSYATRLLYLDAVSNNVKKFIYLSTFHVYGTQDGFVDESHTTNPKSDYAMSHFFAEKFLEQLSFDKSVQTITVRLTNGMGLPLEGVTKWYLAINDFCKTAYLSNSIELNSSGIAYRDFVGIKDIVRAVYLLTHKVQSTEKYSVYNVSSQEVHSIKEVAYIVADVYEKRFNKKIRITIPQEKKGGMDHKEKLFVSSEKLRKLGWDNSSSLQDVINEIFDYLDSASEV